MKKIESLKRIAIAALFCIVLASCGATMQTRVQQVQLGMNRQDVINRIGKDFRVMSLVQTEQGNLEILRFINTNILEGHEYYYAHFLDGRLVELHFEDPTLIPPVPPHPNSLN
ncbi:MAG: hypothetical protein LBV43_05380 [Prevotella sp.]|jgi:hypothetical protein|nr:hypothetical protein [Prevotella sp.]